MRMVKSLLMGMLMLAGLPVLAQTGFQAGQHYFLIDEVEDAAQDTIQVTEVFSYACPHCNTFQSYVEPWHKNLPDNVAFDRIAVSFTPAWEPLAVSYYTAEVLGILEQSHKPMFDALHTERRRFRSLDDLAEFYSQFGVTKEQFLATAQSFAVDAKIRRGEALARKYGITGTPSLIVDGKYRIAAGGQLSSYEQLLDVADYLIAQQQAAQPTTPDENVPAAESAGSGR